MEWIADTSNNLNGIECFEGLNTFNKFYIKITKMTVI